jgi:uncharacterized membrane protein YqjE
MVQQAPPAKQDRSLGELLAELTQEMVTLVRQEITLARVEMTAKVSHIGQQVGLLAVGGMLAYSGLLAIIAAVIILLAAAGLPWWASALLVGIVVVGSGAFLAWKGLQALKTEDLTPRETIATLKGDKTWIRQQTR